MYSFAVSGAGGATELRSGFNGQALRGSSAPKLWSSKSSAPRFFCCSSGNAGQFELVSSSFLLCSCFNGKATGSGHSRGTRRARDVSAGMRRPRAKNVPARMRSRKLLTVGDTDRREVGKSFIDQKSLFNLWRRYLADICHPRKHLLRRVGRKEGTRRKIPVMPPQRIIDSAIANAEIVYNDEYYKYGPFGPYRYRKLLHGVPDLRSLRDWYMEFKDDEEFEEAERDKQRRSFSRKLNMMDRNVGIHFYYVFARSKRHDNSWQLPWQEWTLAAQVAVESSEKPHPSQIRTLLGASGKKQVEICVSWCRPDLVWVPERNAEIRFIPVEDYITALVPLLNPETEMTGITGIEREKQTYYYKLCEKLGVRQTANEDEMLAAFACMDETRKSSVLEHMLYGQPVELLPWGVEKHSLDAEAGPTWNWENNVDIQENEFQQAIDANDEETDKEDVDHRVYEHSGDEGSGFDQAEEVEDGSEFDDTEGSDSEDDDSENSADQVSDDGGTETDDEDYMFGTYTTDGEMEYLRNRRERLKLRGHTYRSRSHREPVRAEDTGSRHPERPERSRVEEAKSWVDSYKEDLWEIEYDFRLGLVGVARYPHKEEPDFPRLVDDTDQNESLAIRPFTYTDMLKEALFIRRQCASYN